MASTEMYEIAGVAHSDEDVEGLERDDESWGDYPLEDIMIRNETRTIEGVMRRIRDSVYIMDPDFQRDFIWSDDKQSKLVESVIMRIPLPVFYLAEDSEGRMTVVDGLQRLSTFQRFLNDELKLRLPYRKDLDGRRLSQLPPNIRRRIEDCNLILYIIDQKAPERAKLDIFERVNGGEPLTRQQMRNCLYMGEATRFLRNETKTDEFLNATGGSLNQKSMRDREFINRFCAFYILGVNEYRKKFKGNMDDFLAESLTKINRFSESEILNLSEAFRRGLSNNYLLFEDHSFRKSLGKRNPLRRSMLNASLWDVMCTGLSRYSEQQIRKNAAQLRREIRQLFDDQEFDDSISIATNNVDKVCIRFEKFKPILEDI